MSMLTTSQMKMILRLAKQQIDNIMQGVYRSDVEFLEYRTAAIEIANRITGEVGLGPRELSDRIDYLLTYLNETDEKQSSMDHIYTNITMIKGN